MVEIRKKDPKPFGNIAAGIYGIQKQKVIIGKGKDPSIEDVVEVIGTEPIDFKNFDELREKVEEIGIYNLEALEAAKAEKKEYFIQKVLVTL